ncbi:MAG: Gfo/Idh/MocA family oxidoreductase [Phycisphaeraceae bacterium]|nr:Gfo/Idh/MocA family oxidoreductase [Phycisphaeraceae bacterium]
MSDGRELPVGVVGLGFMGRTHVRSYRQAARAGAACRVVAVHSADGMHAPSAAGNLDTGVAADDALDPALVRWCPTLDDLASDDRVELVSVCTPTDTHVAVAERLLAAGKHVLVEKPVATDSASVRRLRDAAAAAGRLCMPAMCVRFWPGWDWLRARVADGAYGAVRSAAFTRLGGAPHWSPEFYMDLSRSGGAMFDLHVHDADVIHWLFGMPRSVSSSGDLRGVSTLYRYGPGGPERVTAEGAWVSAPGFAFRMRFTVQFERAVADWDLARPEHERLLLTEGGVQRAVPLAGGAGYQYEAEAMVRAVARGEARAPVTMDEALAATRLLEAEALSQRLGREVALDGSAA